MKTLFSVALVMSAVGLVAQPPAGSEAAAPSPAPAVDLGAPKRSQAELDKLLAPIALYPDALVALILPAATVSSDVVLAVRFLDRHGSGANVDGEDWDESVKALARYPTVLRWMDSNLAWTRQLGGAFLSQPADVMNTVQKLRADARTAGLLTDTPQQRVVEQGAHVLIVPTSPEVIYVPSYNVETVYLRRRYYGHSPFLSFSVAFAAGSWLCYDIDWPRRSVWISSRAHGWVYRPDWRIRHHAHHRPGHLHGHWPTVYVGRHWCPDPVRVDAHSRRYQSVRTTQADTSSEQIIANRPYRFHPQTTADLPTTPSTRYDVHGRHLSSSPRGSTTEDSTEGTRLSRPHTTGRPDLAPGLRPPAGDRTSSDYSSRTYRRSSPGEATSRPSSTGQSRYEGSSWSRPAPAAESRGSRSAPPPAPAPASEAPPPEAAPAPAPAATAPPMPRIRMGR